jgi:hypothetical protein
VLDGPFAEAKEMIGGYFILTCDTFEEAVAIARECPAAQWATGGGACVCPLLRRQPGTCGQVRLSGCLKISDLGLSRTGLAVRRAVKGAIPAPA